LWNRPNRAGERDFAEIDGIRGQGSMRQLRHQGRSGGDVGRGFLDP
jgi:hypothetical protein